MNENTLDFMRLLNLYMIKNDVSPTRAELLSKVNEVMKWESEYKKYTKDQALKLFMDESSIDKLEKVIDHLEDNFTDQALLVVDYIDNGESATTIAASLKKLDGFQKTLRTSISNSVAKEFSFWNAEVIKAEQEAHRVIFWAFFSYGMLLIAVFIFSAYLSRKVSEPIINLRDIASEIAKGNLNRRANVTSGDEIGQLGVAINNMIVTLGQARNITKKVQQLDDEKVLYLSLFPQSLIQFKKRFEHLSNQIKVLLNYQEVLNSVNLFLLEIKQQPQFDDLKLADLKKSSHHIEMIHEKFSEVLTQTKMLLDDFKKTLKHIESFSLNNEMHLEETDITSCILFSVSLIENTLQEKQKLKSEIDILPSTICDARKLVHALTNVLMSSLASIAKEGEINVQAKQVNTEIVINIVDTGFGMSNEIKEELLNPTMNGNVSGKNIRLFIAREIILENGGSMEIESEMGKGTNFTVKLPITQITQNT
ncbi:MAG: HAMP domain-containing histidine kinase [Proteobacteria bacterium]|nr:HAMP domain-containing histidine kinase [Pseudomonadota bacterium]